MLLKNLFITIEGIDGCGKTTFAKALSQKLLQNGVSCLLTKEPGGSELGKYLRKILQKHPDPICDKTEYLLFAADRAQHYQQVILPALKNESIVISDRWADSSVAYQGYGRQLDVNIIKAVNKWVTNGLRPNIIFYVKIDIETALARIAKREESLKSIEGKDGLWNIEQEKIDFWNRVLSGYEELYKNDNSVTVLDGQSNTDDLVSLAMKVLSQYENFN